jgi:hypothetical protein
MGNLNKISKCDKKVYRKGEHVLTIIDLEPSEIEKIVQSAAKESGQKIDWHYFGGRAIVKVLGNIESARQHLKDELEKRNYQGYRFTTDNDSVIPWSLR